MLLSTHICNICTYYNHHIEKKTLKEERPRALLSHKHIEHVVTACHFLRILSSIRTLSLPHAPQLPWLPWPHFDSGQHPPGPSPRPAQEASSRSLKPSRKPHLIGGIHQCEVHNPLGDVLRQGTSAQGLRLRSPGSPGPRRDGPHRPQGDESMRVGLQNHKKCRIFGTPLIQDLSHAPCGDAVAMVLSFC